MDHPVYSPIDAFANAPVQVSPPPFLLTGLSGAWWIHTGYADVFAVSLEAGQPVSRRRHLCRLEGGGLLPGLPEAAPNGVGLLVVTGMNTELVFCDADWTAAARWSQEQAATLGEAVERWLRGLTVGILGDRPGPRDYEALTPGTSVLVQDGACLLPPRGWVWLQLDEGAATLRHADMAVLHASPVAWPVEEDCVLQARGVCQGSVFSTQDRLAAGQTRADLASFHAALLTVLIEHHQQQRTAERVRLHRRLAASQDAIAGAFERLASVMIPRPVPPVSADDPLLAAMRLVGAARNIEIQAPPVRARRERDRLAEIARISRIRTRRVVLAGAWWRHDHGPLIGLLTHNDERIPVALLPRHRRTRIHYSMHDPTTGQETPVDEAVAESLQPFGYALYRPFAETPLTALDVFKFGIQESRSDLFMVMLMGLAGGLLGMITPIMTGVIFNTVIPEAGRGQLVAIVFALIASAVAVGLFELVRGLSILRLETKMDATVQAAVWDRLLKLPTSFFRQFSAGGLAVRAGGISQIRQMLSGATITSLLAGVFSVFHLGLLFYYDVQLALWACALTAVALGAMLLASYLQLRHQRQVSALQSKLSGMVLQIITGIMKLRVAGAETKALERWAETFADQRTLQFKARRVGNFLATFNAAFPVLSLMVIFSAIMLREDLALATGDFIAFNAALATFTSHVLSMTGAFVAILMAVPIYEQAKPILQALPEVDDTKAHPGELSGAIEVQHLAFRYNPEAPMILRDVSIEAKPGEFIALVGPSGSGKSTVLRVLLGFEEPEGGAVYYDGQELSGLDVQSVRRQIGVVLQDGRLMSGDLFTNITGSSMATMDDAWEAARMAGLDDDIKTMPMGMHTVVSEGGTTLSGGQRQRLMIARAIVGKPRILFFDEATSALDNRTQAIVSESLERLQATRIVVAHRLSTIQQADRIYVIDRGQVAQSGSYEELLAEGGLFGELVQRQIE
ncbi:MAG: NHLP bacteriocin export ABC transporter permease/ATPase subunit [Bacteroidota bacterium]